MSLEFSDRDRESVVRDLSCEDEEVRRLAVERVDVLPSDVGIPCLIDCLGDSSWRVRKAAVERLVACKESEQVATALVAALADGDNPGRRNAAVEALIKCGSRVVEPLLVATASPDDDVRKLVVDALAGIAQPRSKDKLLEMLSDPDPNVRGASADALALVAGDDVGRALLCVATTTDEDQLVRFSAIRALDALGFPVRAVDLGSIIEDPMLGAGALALLGRADDDEQATAVLLKALSLPARSKREAAMRSILAIVASAEPEFEREVVNGIRATVAADDQIVANAVEQLASADLSAALVLVQFLGLVRAEDAVIPVLIAGRDEALSPIAQSTLVAIGEPTERIIDASWPDFDVASRRDSCVLFGQTNGPRSSDRLLSALEDTAGEVRTAAARAIGQRKLASGLDPLIRRLVETASDDDYESEEEHCAVIDGLTALVEGSPPGREHAIPRQAIARLAASLDAGTEEVRLAVASVIGRIGRQEGRETAEFLLRDPSAVVRRAAVEALAQIEPCSDNESLRLALADESALVRIAAARALGTSSSESVVDDLARLAVDEDSSVRAAAVLSIVTRFIRSDDEHHHSVAIRVIDAALEDDAPVALSAIEALCDVGGAQTSRAESMLDRSEPELVRQAIRCLATHADDAGLESLLPLIAHSDWSVRAEAIQAVADRGMIRAVPAILRRLEAEEDDFVRESILQALRRLEGGVA
jgi:HEAT repeat protein